MTQAKPLCCDLWSDDLSEAQLKMVAACKGDGAQLGDSVGYELHGADFSVARALERKGLGYIAGMGGPLPPLFWLNEEGVRIAHEFDPEPEDCDICGGFGCANCGYPV
jgi:hypothetical protein